jgi:hypothetical protein
MGEQTISIPAQLSGFRTLADRTLSFKVNTQELSPQLMAVLFGYEQSLGYFFFSPTEMHSVDIPMDRPEFPNAKSPSQRLYNVMFRLFKSMQDKKLIKERADFEEFRRNEIEKLITAYKRRISEI